MYNTYEDACEAVVTRAAALKEVKKHSCDEGLFLLEVGDKFEYTGQEILDWLGY